MLEGPAPPNIASQVVDSAPLTVKPPNGLPLSCRERWKIYQKITDLVREAVCYSGVLDGTLGLVFNLEVLAHMHTDQYQWLH